MKKILDYLFPENRSDVANKAINDLGRETVRPAYLAAERVIAESFGPSPKGCPQFPLEGRDQRRYTHILLQARKAGNVLADCRIADHTPIESESDDLTMADLHELGERGVIWCDPSDLTIAESDPMDVETVERIATQAIYNDTAAQLVEADLDAMIKTLNFK